MDTYNFILYLCMGLMCINLVLVLVRFAQGPSMPDRVVALDVFSANILVLLALYAITSAQRVVLDIAVLLSLITFLGTMVFAWYLVRHKAEE